MRAASRFEDCPGASECAKADNCRQEAKEALVDLSAEDEELVDIMLLHMYGGLFQKLDSIGLVQSAQLYSMGRRLDIHNLPEVAIDRLEWIMDDEKPDKTAMKTMITIAYAETPKNCDTDQWFREDLVVHLVEEFRNGDINDKDWFEELFAISGAFGLDFAARISGMAETYGGVSPD